MDKAINYLVIKSIKQRYPEHGLMGEEADYGSGKEELQWICDPLDGTKSFILGVPLTTFILGLAKQGKLLLSVIYNPFTDQSYYAQRGGGAFCDGEPTQVNKRPWRMAAT